MRGFQNIEFQIVRCSDFDIEAGTKVVRPRHETRIVVTKFGKNLRPTVAGEKGNPRIRRAEFFPLFVKTFRGQSDSLVQKICHTYHETLVLTTTDGIIAPELMFSAPLPIPPENSSGKS